MLQRHLLSSAGLAIFLFNGFTQFSPSRSHTNCQFSEAVGGGDGYLCCVSMALAVRCERLVKPFCTVPMFGHHLIRHQKEEGRYVNNFSCSATLQVHCLAGPEKTYALSPPDSGNLMLSVVSLYISFRYLHISL